MNDPNAERMLRKYKGFTNAIKLMLKQDYKRVSRKMSKALVREYVAIVEETTKDWMGEKE